MLSQVRLWECDNGCAFSVCRRSPAERMLLIRARWGIPRCRTVGPLSSRGGSGMARDPWRQEPHRIGPVGKQLLEARRQYPSAIQGGPEWGSGNPGGSLP